MPQFKSISFCRHCLALSGMCLLGIPFRVSAQTQTTAPNRDPLLDSWLTKYSGRYARVVEQPGGKLVSTWPSAGMPNRGGGQSKPAYSDIQQVGFSRDWVYVQGNGLASHQMGPWGDEVGRIFGNWPANQNYVRRFPRTPKPATVKVINGLGSLGLWVNGVALFNPLDGAYYDPASKREIMGRPARGGDGDIGLWVRNAVVVEQPTFDKSNAHQPPNGEYHYHDNPTGLRAQLGDNIAGDANKGYREDASRLHHSPILGWSNDGYPIYGPYAYADPKNPKSAVKRMVSGFVLRDGTNHTPDLRQTGRRSMAKWAADLHKVKPALDESQWGPDAAGRFALGRYVEDFDFLGDLGKTQGKDFDLDVHNGRFGVTPDFPQGTYAYFVTLNADGSPAFPYVVGRQWYGEPLGGDVRRLGEEITLYTDAGPNSASRLEVAATAKGKTLTWTSVDGGHYRVDGSADGKTWTTLAGDKVSGGATTILALDGKATSWSHFRVTLTSLDEYDVSGSRGQQRRGR